MPRKLVGCLHLTKRPLSATRDGKVSPSPVLPMSFEYTLFLGYFLPSFGICAIVNLRCFLLFGGHTVAYHYEIDRHVTIVGKARVLEKHVRAHTEEEYAKKIAKLQAQADSTLELDDPTVREYSDYWLKEYKILDGLTKKSSEMYTRMLRLYILPTIGNWKLNYINNDAVTRVLVRMRGKSKAYQHHCLVVMRRMFRQAWRTGYIDIDPTTDVEYQFAVEPKKKRNLTRDEREAFERAADREKMLDGRPNRNGALFLITINAGLRPGEVCALRKEDLDFENLMVKVRQARERGSKNIKPPKTAAGTREIPLTPRFASWLQDWLKRNPTRPECPLAFAQRDGMTMISESSYARRWEAFLRLVDLELGAELKTVPGEGRKHKKVIRESALAPDIHPYMMRSTFATDCIKAGVKPNVLCYIMGHSDIKTTNEYYVIVDNELLAEGREALDDYISGKSKKKDQKTVTTDDISEKDLHIEELREALMRVKQSEQEALNELEERKKATTIGSRHNRERMQRTTAELQKEIERLKKENEQLKQKMKAESF